MFYSIFLVLILIILLSIDLKRNKDLLSPIVLVTLPILGLFFLPSILKLYFGQGLVYIPKFIDPVEITEFANSFLFLTCFCFGFCFLICQKLAGNLKVPQLEVQFRNQSFFGIYLVLAFGSFFALMSLLPYNIGSYSAYYNMSGFGPLHWLSGILLFNAPFLFVGSKQHQWWAYPAVACNLLIVGFLLGRGTGTAFILLCLLIILRESFKLSFKAQVLIFVGIPGAIILYKFLSIPTPQSFVDLLTWFLTFDLGRFDYLAGAMFFKLEGLKVDLIHALRYVPFFNYFPYLRDLNESFQALPEQLFLGSRVSEKGGLPFTMQGELALMVGPIGHIVLSSLWGVIFGFVYRICKESGNSFLLGFYALFLYSGRNLGFAFFAAILPVLIFVTIFCKVKVSENCPSAA